MAQKKYLDQNGLSYLWDKIKGYVNDHFIGNVIGRAHGNVVSFSDGMEGTSLKTLTVGIEPVQSGSGDPSPDNVRPITGWTGANIYVSPTGDPADGRTYSVEFPSEAGTVYGGTLDATSGVLTVTHVLYEFTADMVRSFGKEGGGKINRIYLYRAVYAGNSAYQAGICDKYKVVNSFASVRDTPNSIALNTGNGNQILIGDSSVQTIDDVKNAMPVHVYYPLSSPLTYQLTPIEITTLLGTNMLWADTGDILELEYVRGSASDIEYIASQSDAKTVNGHTVQSDVPADAIFIDTEDKEKLDDMSCTRVYDDTLEYKTQSGWSPVDITLQPFTAVAEASVEWELGAIASSSGANSNSSTRLRTVTYLPAGVSEITPASGYRFVLMAYDDGTYIGSWNGTSYAKTATWLTSKVEASDIGQHDFRIVLARNPDSGDMTVNEKSNIIIAQSARMTINDLAKRTISLEKALMGIDLSDPESAIYALALRVAQLEAHAILDSGYPSESSS